mmetsp:Transcript_49499/g.139309  ORF Transcript_49499/g.139309 Transcript_49499/m.139309 type:complete len:312 (-) Transcript_49499:77-1012(-)
MAPCPMPTWTPPWRTWRGTSARSSSTSTTQMRSRIGTTRPRWRTRLTCRIGSTTSTTTTRSPLRLGSRRPPSPTSAATSTRPASTATRTTERARMGTTFHTFISTTTMGWRTTPSSRRSTASSSTATRRTMVIGCPTCTALAPRRTMASTAMARRSTTTKAMGPQAIMAIGCRTCMASVSTSNATKATLSGQAAQSCRAACMAERVSRGRPSDISDCGEVVHGERPALRRGSPRLDGRALVVEPSGVSRDTYTPCTLHPKQYRHARYGRGAVARTCSSRRGPSLTKSGVPAGGQVCSIFSLWQVNRARSPP